MLLAVTLFACSVKEVPVDAGHPADPNAASPQAPSLGVLGSTFSPEAVAPKASSTPDPHEHHKHGGHEH